MKWPTSTIALLLLSALFLTLVVPMEGKTSSSSARRSSGGFSKFFSRVRNAGKFVSKIRDREGKAKRNFLSNIKNKVRSAATKVKRSAKANRKFKALASKIKNFRRNLKKSVRNFRTQAQARRRARGKKIDKLFKAGKKKLSQKFKKFSRSIKKKLSQKAKKVARALKVVNKKITQKVKKVSRSLKNKVLKKFKTLKISGKFKSSKVWKAFSRAFKKAKTSIRKTTNGLKQKFKKLKDKVKQKFKKDQTRGVYKIPAINKLNPNAKVTPETKITAKEVALASIMSRNAYEKNSDKKLQQQGYQIIKSIDHKKQMCASKIFYNPKDRTIVVSYRGTVSNSLTDWKNNLKFGLKPTYFNGKYAGKLHKGFLSQYLLDRNTINAIIDQYQKQGKIDKIIYTGHSKGAALSEIAATDYKLNHKGANVELITFGSPRVGDKKHAQIVNDNVKDYVRVVNSFGKSKQDIVTKVPPQLFGYAHAGVEVRVGCGKNNGVSCHLLKNYISNSGPK